MEGNSLEAFYRKRIKLTGTEIVLLVFILMLLEAVVFYLAVIHGGSVSAMSYVSFAGTLISIILGVVAIFYTMVESLKQSNSSDKIANGAADIERNSNKISSEVNKLSEAIQEITEISARVKKIETIAGDIAIGLGQNAQITFEDPKNTENMIANSVKSHFFIGPLCAALCLVCASKQERGLEFVTGNSFIRVQQKVFDCSNIDYASFRLAFFIYLRLFQSMGVFSVDSKGSLVIKEGKNYQVFFEALLQIKNENTQDSDTMNVRHSQLELLLKEATN